MTDLITAAQQALEALEAIREADTAGATPKMVIEARSMCDEAIPALRAAMPQQAEPVAAERERCAEYLMQQAAECRENSPTRVTLESCAAVLRLGLHAQAEPVEPVAWIQPDHLQKARVAPFLCRVEPTKRCADFVPFWTAPPQRKPLMEGMLMGVYIDFDRAADPAWSKAEYLLHFARAIERAHGIGGSDE